MNPLLVLISGLAGAVIAAFVGWFANYHVQNRVHRLHLRVDELRHALYGYLNLANRYWLSSGTNRDKRKRMEAEILSAQNVISTEYSLLARNYRQLRKSYQETKPLRIMLWSAATGGCFQQEQWSPEQDRARSVTKGVTAIVKSLG
ncbi:hypothetical protein [Candidatus Foliamicus sp.]